MAELLHENKIWFTWFSFPNVGILFVEIGVVFAKGSL